MRDELCRLGEKLCHALYALLEQRVDQHATVASVGTMASMSAPTIS
jgi:hypothetical protein